MDARSPDEQRYLEIDNPGAGDCAFYAFIIGLIDIIQDQLLKNSKMGQTILDNLLIFVMRNVRKDASRTTKKLEE